MLSLSLQLELLAENESTLSDQLELIICYGLNYCVVYYRFRNVPLLTKCYILWWKKNRDLAKLVIANRVKSFIRKVFLQEWTFKSEQALH